LPGVVARQLVVIVPREVFMGKAGFGRGKFLKIIGNLAKSV
jgi:hypothetical protein